MYWNILIYLPFLQLLLPFTWLGCLKIESKILLAMCKIFVWESLLYGVGINVDEEWDFCVIDFSCLGLLGKLFFSLKNLTFGRNLINVNYGRVLYLPGVKDLHLRIPIAQWWYHKCWWRMRFRDVSTGATGATQVASKFWDTLTLTPPGCRFFPPTQTSLLNFPHGYVPEIVV